MLCTLAKDIYIHVGLLPNEDHVIIYAKLNV